MQIWLEQVLIGVKTHQRGADRSDSIDFWLRKMGTDDMALDLARVGVSQTLQKEVEVILIDAPRYPPVIRRCLSADSYPPKLGMVNRLCTEPGDS